MPRDASGNYSLPAGNPVIPGTTITADWANSTMADVGNELTNSLDRSGRGGMLAPILFSDGTVNAPSFAYSSEPTLGFYRKGAAQVAFVALGAERVVFSNALMSVTTNATIAGTLGVTGATTLGALTVNGALNASNIAITGGTMSGVAITGGTINATPIGGTTPAAGAFSTLNATGGGALTGTWSNLGSVTTIDINGGSIDGTPIGAAARSTALFTTLGANGAVSFGSTLVVTGATTLNGTVGGTGMNAYARLANNETVTGTWTFNNPIAASITGNAATATSAGTATTATNALNLGGFPAANYPRRNVAESISAVWTFTQPIAASITGNAATATTATTATNATQLGGFAAANYPRKAEVATISAAWTFSSNVTVPLVPTANAHAASKKYVDDIASSGFNPADNQTITGTWGFSQPVAFSNATVPFSVVSTALVANLNADRVDNLQGSQFLRSDAADSASGILTFSATSSFTNATKPFSVTSTALVTNLNADRVDSLHATSFLRRDTSSTAAGVITFTAVPIHPNGTAALPGLRLTTEGNMGFFRAAANAMGFSQGGAEVSRWIGGNLLLGTTVNAGAKLIINTTAGAGAALAWGAGALYATAGAGRVDIGTATPAATGGVPGSMFLVYE